MKKILLLITILTSFLQVKSQEIEIYLMQNNNILHGKLLESSDDSIRIRVDSLNTFAFAKSELEGKDLPVSKRVKKFRKALIRKESQKSMHLFPGIYQIRNEETTKGRIMYVISTLGIVGVISSGIVFVAIISSIPGLYGLLVAFADSVIVLAASTTLWFANKVWTSVDILKTIGKNVNNRYYYQGLNKFISAEMYKQE